jgi:hypothetical protein
MLFGEGSWDTVPLPRRTALRVGRVGRRGARTTVKEEGIDMTRRLAGSKKTGWQLLVLAGVLQAAAGCGSSSAVGGTGGTDGGADGGGVGGKLGGVGGRTGTGGSSPVDAANPACAANLYGAVSAFGAIFDQWAVASNSTPPELAPTIVDGATTSGTLMELDPSDGNPTNGSIKLTIPFTAPNQTLLFARLYNGVNMHGATITAKVKLDMGLITGPTDIGQAFIVLKTTIGYIYAAGPDITLDPTAGWMTITANADAPSANLSAGYTSCDVRELDVVIQTGPTGNYQQAVVHIDTISISYPAGVDAGGDDGPATDAGIGDATVIGDGAADGDAPADAIIDAPASTDTAADATGG